MENEITCFRKCNCVLKTIEKSNEEIYNDEMQTENKQGAGVCVISPKGILLSQSHNLFWGIPKGLLETNETIIECALRELYEETGLQFKEHDLCKIPIECSIYHKENDYSMELLNSEKLTWIFKYNHLNRTVFIFFVILDDIIELKSNNLSNDSTGFGFIHPRCILELVYSNKIRLNYFTRILIQLLFGL